MIRFLSITFVIAALSIPLGTAHGQIPATDLRIVPNPENPEPQEEVILTAESFSFDIERANITWIIDGSVQLEGMGREELTITAGAAGTATRVVVRAQSNTGRSASAELVLRPATVDILLDADTYTPPFYRGRALPTAESSVRLIAEPFIFTNGSRVDPNGLIYTWRRNGDVMNDASGFGRRTISLDAPRVFQQDIITVEVATTDSSRSASDGIAMRATEPDVVVYEDHPLEGVRYERAFETTFELEQPEITLRAEPYFFPITALRQEDLDVSWKLNNQTISPQTLFEAIFRRPDEGGGRSRVDLEIRDNTNLQQAAASLFVRFNEPQ